MQLNYISNLQCPELKWQQCIAFSSLCYAFFVIIRGLISAFVCMIYASPLPPLYRKHYANGLRSEVFNLSSYIFIYSVCVDILQKHAARLQYNAVINSIKFK